MNFEIFGFLFIFMNYEWILYSDGKFMRFFKLNVILFKKLCFEIFRMYRNFGG